MLRSSAVFLLLAVAAAHAADKPNRDMLELQREVAQLQDVVTKLQQSLEARFTTLAAQVQATGDATAQVNAGIAGVQKGIAQIAQDQDRKVLPVVAAQGTRLDQLAAALATIQQALADQTTAINRLQTQMVDLGNAVKVIQYPPAPPKPSAEELMKGADADKLGGKYDLAAQGYSDFLKYYGDTPQADVALFELGMAHYAMKNYELAVADYDALAQKYADSKRLPEGLFYKWKSLQELRRTADARAACLDLRKRFPANDFAKQCVVAR
jgi:TolA-binding protein